MIKILIIGILSKKIKLNIKYLPIVVSVDATNEKEFANVQPIKTVPFFTGITPYCTARLSF